jgi:Tol biopolymer transport system component
VKRRMTSAAASMIIIVGLCITSSSAHATVPGPNGLIVYGSALFPSDDTDTFTINADGTGENEIYSRTAGCTTWSPDGTKVLLGCVFRRNSLVRPATIDPDGRHFTLLNNPDPTLNLFCWSWSPDGNRLACEGGDDVHPERDALYTVRASDGGDLQLLTKNPYGAFFCCPVKNQDGAPRYSPDGTRIMFTRFNDRGQSAAFIVNVDGTGTRQLTPWAIGAFGGNWSPDGEWIVFNMNDDSRFQGRLYLMHPDGSDRHMIDIDTGGTWYYAKEPAWSPDGTRIVFVMYAGSNGGQVDLFTVAPDGTDLTEVTASPEVEYVPDWGTHTSAP